MIPSVHRTGALVPFNSHRRHGNSVCDTSSDKSPRITKRYGKPRPSLRSFKYACLQMLGFSIPIEFRSPIARRDFEEATLGLWQEHGFHVPQTFTSRATDVVLVQQRLDGPTLGCFLRDNQTCATSKRQSVTNIFVEMRRRHLLALKLCRNQLIHYDPNPGNILITEHGPAWIDFEMCRLNEKTELSAARETHKFLLEITNVVGPDGMDWIIEDVTRHYALLPILRQVVSRSIDRRFSWLHLHHDRKRKLRRPGLITKYDVAKRLSKQLAQTGATQTESLQSDASAVGSNDHATVSCDLLSVRSS